MQESETKKTVGQLRPGLTQATVLRLPMERARVGLTASLSESTDRTRTTTSQTAGRGPLICHNKVAGGTLSCHMRIIEKVGVSGPREPLRELKEVEWVMK